MVILHLFPNLHLKYGVVCAHFKLNLKIIKPKRERLKLLLAHLQSYSRQLTKYNFKILTSNINKVHILNKQLWSNNYLLF